MVNSGGSIREVREEPGCGKRGGTEEREEEEKF